jgi:hypothetical protein
LEAVVEVQHRAILRKAVVLAVAGVVHSFLAVALVQELPTKDLEAVALEDLTVLILAVAVALERLEETAQTLVLELAELEYQVL